MCPGWGFRIWLPLPSRDVRSAFAFGDVAIATPYSPFPARPCTRAVDVVPASYSSPFLLPSLRSCSPSCSLFAFVFVFVGCTRVRFLRHARCADVCGSALREALVRWVTRVIGELGETESERTTSTNERCQSDRVRSFEIVLGDSLVSSIPPSSLRFPSFWCYRLYPVSLAPFASFRFAVSSRVSSIPSFVRLSRSLDSQLIPLSWLFWGPFWGRSRASEPDRCCASRA